MWVTLVRWARNPDVSEGDRPWRVQGAGAGLCQGHGTVESAHKARAKGSPSFHRELWPFARQEPPALLRAEVTVFASCGASA